MEAIAKYHLCIPFTKHLSMPFCKFKQIKKWDCMNKTDNVKFNLFIDNDLSGVYIHYISLQGQHWFSILNNTPHSYNNYKYYNKI